MKRTYILSCILLFVLYTSAQDGVSERAYLVNSLTKIADPVLTALSKKELKKTMPIEKFNGMQQHHPSTYLEGFARLLAGMAPWLELGPDATPEGELRKKYINLALQCIHNGTDSTSPDYLDFNIPGQSLVDAAFLSSALLRAPHQLMEKLDEPTKANLVAALKLTRNTKPPQNNWLLFAGTVETLLLKLTGECDQQRIDYALQKHKEWYKGDGVYGDGTDFHFDYYNSFVIHPLMMEILGVTKEKNIPTAISYETELKRSRRYAAILERMISPEATYPVTGRSIAYRFGNFQLLSLMALQHHLPEEVSPVQVRSALYTMIKKQMEAPGTFDSKGWLQIGIYGHQPGIGEYYISTGSLYLCSQAFLILGLPASDALWQGKDEDWTAKKVWKGLPVPIDHAISQ
jgi:hypothetical protein